MTRSRHPIGDSGPSAPAELARWRGRSLGSMSRGVLHGLALALAFLLALALPLPFAGAAEGDGESSEAARRDEIDAELDLLEQSDVELQSRLTELDGEIARQQAVVDQAEEEREQAEAEVEQLLVEVTAAERRAADQLDLLHRRAVEAYVNPRADVLDALVGTDEYTEFHERTVLLGHVAEHDQRLLDEYLTAQAELDGQRLQAEEAETRASEAEAEAEAGLERVQVARSEQEAVRTALQGKIADFRSEADALASQEAALAAVIEEQAASAPAVQAEPSAAESGGAPAEGPLPEPPEPPSSGGGATTTSTPAPPPGGGGGTSTTAAPPSTSPTTQPPASGGFVWPTNGVLTSPFGFRWGRMHNGIDIGAPTGTTIRAAQAGTVYFAGWMNGYGNTVLIDHGGGMTTLYAHQSSIAVGAGTRVARGQTIGYVGSTGNSTGPHLHFEVRIGGSPRDPMGYLP